MDIELSGDDRVREFAVSGRIDSYTAEEVQTQLLMLLENEPPAGLVVDLEQTEYVSSAGLRVLITLAKRAAQEGFALRLCALQPTVLEVFEIAGFTRLFEIRASRAEAVNELSSS